MKSHSYSVYTKIKKMMLTNYSWYSRCSINNLNLTVLKHRLTSKLLYVLLFMHNSSQYPYSQNAGNNQFFFSHDIKYKKESCEREVHTTSRHTTLKQRRFNVLIQRWFSVVIVRSMVGDGPPRLATHHVTRRFKKWVCSTVARYKLYCPDLLYSDPHFTYLFTV